MFLQTADISQEVFKRLDIVAGKIGELGHSASKILVQGQYAEGWTNIVWAVGWGAFSTAAMGIIP